MGWTGSMFSMGSTSGASMPRLRDLALLAIRGYQRFLSPYKGFCCAYRSHTGRCSCSTLGFRAVRRYGTLRGLAVLRRRMYLCGVAHRRYAPMPTRPARPPRAQRGDCACDLPCDFGGGGASGAGDCDAGDVLNGCSNCQGCDWPSSSKRKERDYRRYHRDAKNERHVYVPPARGG